MEGERDVEMYTHTRNWINFAQDVLVLPVRYGGAVGKTVKGDLGATGRGRGWSGRGGRGKKLRKVHHLLLSRPSEIAYQRANEGLPSPPLFLIGADGIKARDGEIKCAQPHKR